VQEERDRTKYEQQRLEATRSAAMEFAEKGFHGASTADIARRMGIKQGSLYYYFKSKEEALFEVCMLGIGDYARRMEAIAGNKQPFEAKLLATVGSHLSSYREKHEALKVYNAERLYLSDIERQDLKLHGSRYRQLLEGIFKQGVRDGVLRDTTDCHFAALAVISLCNGWGELIVRDHDLDIFSLVQNCTDMLLNGFCRKQT
jgi:TetR/AcrR family transcriptional regulator, cholesterol catabolism regulator